jgi:hypothetical protein
MDAANNNNNSSSNGSSSNNNRNHVNGMAQTVSKSKKLVGSSRHNTCSGRILTVVIAVDAFCQTCCKNEGTPGNLCEMMYNFVQSCFKLDDPMD